MDNEKIILSNDNPLCSELNEDDVSLTAKFIICDFLTNGNNVRLNRETAENWIHTLVSQPVVGKIGITDSGTADFTSHNLHPVIRLSKDGGIYADTEFDSSAFGVFTSVQIEKINGKEYITATAKIWKRFTNFCAVIQKRLSESSIATSWEIVTKKKHEELEHGKKIKVIDDGIFLGHCLLSAFIPPAYKDSCLLEVASENNGIDLIEALNKDISEGSYKEIKKEDKQVAEITETPIADTTTGEVKTDTSMLTQWDLGKALRGAIATKLNIERWDFDIFYHFPADKIIWVKLWNALDLDVITFTYTVENDVVTLSEPSNEKLTVSIAEINNTVATLNTEITTKNEALISANESIQTLNTQIAELIPFKDKFEKIEQERIVKELSENQTKLKDYAIQSGRITSEEIETSSVEVTSQKVNFEKLNITGEEDVASYKSVMKSFLKK